VRVPPKQDAEVVEPSNNSLKLHTIHEKYRHWCLILSNMI